VEGAFHQPDNYIITLLHNFVLLEGFLTAIVLGFTPSWKRKAKKKIAQFSERHLTQDGSLRYPDYNKYVIIYQSFGFLIDEYRAGGITNG
jgi:hypothetical protein